MSDPFPGFFAVLDRLALPRAARARIIEGHGEPQRHYHTLRHVDLMLREIPADHAFAREMFLATLFHDIVYDPAKPDNEEQSLATFLSAAGTFASDPPFDLPLVSAMILATKGHNFLDEADSRDAAVNLLLEADLSILWHPEPAVYAWYAEGVRKEYAFVPDGSFREARKRILIALRDDILRSGRLTAEKAKALKRNIAWELG